MDTFLLLFLISMAPASFIAALLEHRRRALTRGVVAMWTLGLILIAVLFDSAVAQMNPKERFKLVDLLLLRQVTWASDLVAIAYGLGAFYLYLLLFDRQK